MEYISILQSYYPDPVFAHLFIEFILRIVSLAYKPSESIVDGQKSEALRSLQNHLQSELNKLKSRCESDGRCAVSVSFPNPDSPPSVVYDSSREYDELYLHVGFKRIAWEEINEFRMYLNHLIQKYILQYDNRLWKSSVNVHKIVADMTYIIQEMLQNAYEYSVDCSPYDLEMRIHEHRFYVTVTNLATPEDADCVLKIIRDVRESNNMQELLLDYMVSEEKHLGIVTCLVNYPIVSFDVFYENGQLRTECLIDFFTDQPAWQS
jgi:hypothetical protein